MKTRLATISLFLMGCTAMQGSPTFEVHDVLFYGDSNDRITWFYETQMEQNTKPVKINGLGYELKTQTATDSFALPGTLSIIGQSSLMTKTSSIDSTLSKDFSVTYNPAADNYFIRTSRDLEGVFLLQNGNWYRLSGSLNARSSTEAEPEFRSSDMRGIGELTDNEANALNNVLKKDAPLVVGVLKDAPDARLTVEPTPARYRTTALYVQEGIPRENRPTGGAVRYTQVEYAGNSTYRNQDFGAALVTSDSVFATIWQKANAYILPAPAVPDINFANSSAVFLFLGQRSSGGYGFKVNSMESRGTVLTVRVTVSSPKPGSITTQALTSPWGLFTVAGKYTSLRVLDQNGTVLASTTVNRSPL